MKMITRFASLFVLFLGCSGILQAFDGSAFTAEGLQKFYVQGNDVRVANNGIFVFFEGDMLNVSAVYVDSNGAYIAGLGSCRYCGRPNDEFGNCQFRRCKNYGKPS